MKLQNFSCIILINVNLVDFQLLTAEYHLNKQLDVRLQFYQFDIVSISKIITITVLKNDIQNDSVLELYDVAINYIT